VLTGKLPQARMNDICACIGPPDLIAFGSPTVFVGKLPAARMTDPTVKGGIITKGEFTVLIGLKGSAGGGFAPLVMSPPCVALAQQLHESLAAQDDLMLAAATYDPNAPMPANTRRATEADLRALRLVAGDVNLTRIDDSNFSSDVFVRTDPMTGQESYTIGFRGTVPTSGQDWGANLGQGAGADTAYYRRANLCSPPDTGFPLRA